MSSVTPVRIPLETNLDRKGSNLALSRLPGESAKLYRKRLRAEALDPGNGTLTGLRKSIGRQVGLEPIVALRITLRLDENGRPVAEKPAVVVEPTRVLFYSSYPDVVELTCLTRDRAHYYLLEDIVSALESSSCFEGTLEDSDYAYKLSSKLRCGSNLKTVNTFVVQKVAGLELGRQYIADILIGNTNHFVYEMESPEDIELEGQYHIDYLNGVIHTLSGFSGSIDYTYAEFPFRMMWEDIQILELSKEETQDMFEGKRLDEETGDETYGLLNSYGSKVQRVVLSKMGNQWG
jgi:hypothetical protein